MLNDIMEKLRNELDAIKDIITNKGIFEIEDTNRDHDVDFLNGLNYFVILRDGTCFYITMGSVIFPEFNFEDIVYIRKRRALNYNEFGVVKEYIDTENGEFDQEWITDKDILAVKMFNTNFDRQIDTFGYD